MKKRILLMGLVLVMLLTLFVPTMAQGAIKVYLDNKQIVFDVDPLLVNGRTMVPMRAIFEALGAKVYWDNATSTATAIKGNAYVAVSIGSPFMETHSGAVALDAPAMIVNDRTLIPLRAVSEAFNCLVEWDNATASVHIFSENYTDTEQTIVYAATAADLLNAIGSNKKIILTASYYNLSGLAPIDNEHVSKPLAYGMTAFDSYVIENVENMTIEGNAEIAIDDKMADVLKFRECNNITLSGLTIGHTTSYDEYQCEGAVTEFDSCNGVNINNCNLYGCGAIGIMASNVTNLIVTGGKIYDCTYTGIWLTDNSKAIVTGTEFCDSVHLSGFLRIDNSEIKCVDCNIHNIVCSGFEGFIETSDWDDAPSVIAFENCTFSDNTFKSITNKKAQNLTFENCSFVNNIGNMNHPAVTYINCSN